MRLNSAAHVQRACKQFFWAGLASLFSLGLAPATAAASPVAPLPAASEPSLLSEHPFDLELGAGALWPGKGLNAHVRAGAIGSIGVGYRLRYDAYQILRVALRGQAGGLGSHVATVPGYIVVGGAFARLDYLLVLSRHLQPYVAAGIGVLASKAQATEPRSNRTQRRRGVDVAGQLALGLEVPLGARLALAGEGAWLPVGGHFHRSLWAVQLTIRWRL